MEERPSGRLVGHWGLLPKQVEGKEETELVYVIAAADIHPENRASEKVARRLGMRLEREVARDGGPRRLYALEAPAGRSGRFGP